MYTITTEHSFDSAHFLFGYEGKCSNIHGHRWRVVAQVKAKELQSEGQERGMCIDFSSLKKDLRDMVDYYDHSLIIEKDTLRKELYDMLIEENFAVIEVDFRPTAENFSKHFYSLLAKKGYDMAQVSVYETPNNCATYSE